MAYGARLESVLGASPRGFESPILRRCLAPEPQRKAVPGLSCQHPVSTSGALWAPARDSLEPRDFLCGRAAVRRAWSTAEAGAVPVALLVVPGVRGCARCLGARPVGRHRSPARPEAVRRRGGASRGPPPPGVERALRGTCTLEPGPPRDGIIRTSPGQECSKDKGALPGARRILVLPPGRSAPPPAPPGRPPRERAPVPRPSGAACGACAFERQGPRPVPWTVPVRGAPVSARPSGAASGFCAAERPRCAQAPRPSTTSAAGSAASSSPGTKSFEARRPDPMQLHPLAQRESMRRRH